MFTLYTQYKKTMKPYKYILAGMLLGGLSACSSLLDEAPAYSDTDNVIFSSSVDAERSLLGVYQYLGANWGYGQIWQELPALFSGLVVSRPNQNGKELSLLSPLSDDLFTRMAWDGMYKAIAEANGFVEGVAKGALSDEEKGKLIAGGRFVRAVAYYNLVSLWGDIPLKKRASSSDGVAVPRSPKEEIYALIIEDLQYAAEHLDEAVKAGQGSSLAARAYLGKVYHKLASLGIDEQANLQKAKAEFDAVYDSSKFALEANYKNLFGSWVTGSREAIFQLNFVFDPQSTYNRGSNVFAPTSSTPGIAWATNRVSKFAYDLHRGTYPDDPRLQATFLTSWRARAGNNQANPKPQVGDELVANDSIYTYPYRTYTIPGDFVVKNGQPTKVLRQYVASVPYDALSTPTNPSLDEIKAWTPATPVKPEELAAVRTTANLFSRTGNFIFWPYVAKIYDPKQHAQASSKNLMIYRYAEMLLLMADVYNELGDQAKATALANEVLARARTSVTPASRYPEAWTSGLSQSELREKLYFERVFELLGEPNMADLVRFKGVDLFKKLLAKRNSHEFVRAVADSYNTTPHNEAEQLLNKGELTDEFMQKIMLLPIPSSELGGNSALKPKDQNPGY